MRRDVRRFDAAKFPAKSGQIHRPDAAAAATSSRCTLTLGKVKAATPGDTPVDRYNRALSAFGGALDALGHAFDGLAKVAGDDGQPFVETRGVEPRLSEPWRELLGRIDDEMIVWARAFKKAHGTKAGPSAGREENDEPDDADPYAENADETEGNWDRSERVTEGEVTT
jgi:hypothetical protein